MATKKPTKPIEVLESTGEIPIVSIEIPTDYEDLVQDPVRAIDHVSMRSNEMITLPRKELDKLLPIVATVFASIALGATILGIGVMIGTGL
jgi:hypothetical protein